MIVIKIELHPKGNSKKAQLLYKGIITNDATGTPSRGNYFVQLYDKAGRLWKEGHVKNFPRKQLLAWDLLLWSLVTLLKERIKEK